MSRKHILVMTFIVLLGWLGVTFRVQRIGAHEQGIIYIRSDGSIDPVTANDSISRDDDVTYRLKSDITSLIVVERSNIIIDGADHTLEGIGTGAGIDLSYGSLSNVTIKSMKIREFYYGIYLSHCLNSFISGNQIVSNNNDGIYLHHSTDNIISGNIITSNSWIGIHLEFSSDNTISGNYITNNDDGGIYLSYSSDNTISGSNVTSNNNDGIYVKSSSDFNTISKNTVTFNIWDGIHLDHSSSSNIISGNIITSNIWDGIHLEHESDFNTLSGNSITSNTDDGVYISQSSNNTLRNNSMVENRYNFGVEGDETSHFIQDIDTSNKIKDKPIYYWTNKQNMEAPSNAGFVALVNSHNIIVQELELKNNGQGIVLANTTDSRIINNYIADNKEGIRLHNSNNNSVYGNSFVNNTVQVESYNSVNIWNSGYPPGGNYWSDYEERYSDAEELDGSGTWDTPYVINENNQDNYPIIPEFPSFLIVPIFITIATLSIIVHRRKHSI